MGPLGFEGRSNGDGIANCMQFLRSNLPLFHLRDLIWLETKKNEFKNKILPGLWAENARRVFA